MKHDRLFTWLEATVTGFLLSFSAMACMATAFSMEPVSLWVLAAWCLASAALWAFFCCRRLGLILWLGLALVAGILWQNGALEQGVESLLYKVSRVYYDAYKWPIIRWSFRNVQEMDLTLDSVIYWLGFLLAAVTAWTLCRGQASLVAVLPAILPVAACFVVTDTLPNNIYMILFLTTVVVMLLCSLPRQADRARGRRLAALAAVPVFLAVGVLFLAIPRQTYYHREQAQALHDLLMGKYTLTQTIEKLAGKDVQLDSRKVDLSAVGARRSNQVRVLEVTPRLAGGLLYLRVSALDRYTGTQWLESETPLTELYWPSEQFMISTDEVAIKTQYAHEMLYLPYYTVSMDTAGMIRGLPNSKKLNEYSVTRMLAQPESVIGRPEEPETEARRVQMEIASRLPEETKKWALPLAQSIVGDQDQVYYQALMIAEYVKSSAKYDQSTGRMTADQKDFAQWFLEESDTGYCIHFATAGAVLLKALGIPARYVTGYMAQTKAGTATYVTGEEAHAWVEYWLPGYGWTLLECTPAGLEEVERPTVLAPSAPEHTQPETTQGAAPAPEVLPGQATRSWDWLLYLALFTACLGALLLQRQLRLRYRLHRCRTGTPNAMALARWVRAEQLSARLGQAPPKRLLELAQKAKFSPYILTDGELTEFDTFIAYAISRLKKQRFLRRMWHKWVLALY